MYLTWPNEYIHRMTMYDLICAQVGGIVGDFVTSTRQDVIVHEKHGDAIKVEDDSIVADTVDLTQD
jgi:hypothetical protein